MLSYARRDSAPFTIGIRKWGAQTMTSLRLLSCGEVALLLMVSAARSEIRPLFASRACLNLQAARSWCANHLLTRAKQRRVRTDQFLNPAGSPKDRVALQSTQSLTVIDDAEDRGDLVPNTGSCIFEGTMGSTGISLATLARARGYDCCIVRLPNQIVPDDVAAEKLELLERLGATVEAVRPRGIVDPRHVSPC